MNLDPPTMNLLLDAYRTARKTAEEYIILDTVKSDEGAEAYVIRNEQAAPGDKVLWKKSVDPTDKDGASLAQAERNLADQRDRQVVQAFASAVDSLIRQGGWP